MRWWGWRRNQLAIKKMSIWRQHTSSLSIYTYYKCMNWDSRVRMRSALEIHWNIVRWLSHQWECREGVWRWIKGNEWKKYFVTAIPSINTCLYLKYAVLFTLRTNIFSVCISLFLLLFASTSQSFFFFEERTTYTVDTDIHTMGDKNYCWIL